MTIDPVSLAVTAALTAAQMALTATKKIEGQRLEDLNITLADYGTPIPYIYGIRRLEGVPIIWAEEIRERKRRRKTKGGKFNDYTYFGTWAVVVADHQIDAVTRVWFDKHLVYDATGAGPMTPFGGTSASPDDDETAPINLTDHIRIYLGTTTQEPDPRMLATVEAEHGAGSCPAYRGIAYIVFEDVPLEKFGNRIPQISVEATSNGTEEFPDETRDVATAAPQNLHGFTFATDYSRFMFNGHEIWDTAARSLMVSFGGDISGPLNGITRNGVIYSVWDTLIDPHVTIYSPDGLTSGGADIPLEEIASYAQVLSDGEGNEYCLIMPYGNIGDNLQYFNIEMPTPIVLELSFSPSMGLRDDEGNIWVVGGPHGSSNQVGFRCVAGDRAGEEEMITAPTSHGGEAKVWAVHNGEGSFVVSHAGRLFLVDDQTFAIGTTVNHTTSDEDLNRFAAVPPGSRSIWLKYKEVSLTTLATIRTIDFSDWGTSFNTSGMIYDPVNHALILARDASTELTWLYLDRVGSADVTLQDIVEDVAARCGVDAADIDADELDQAIVGYSWTQGSGKDIIAPLLDLYDCDARPHDFGIEVIQRGASSAGTLDVSEFARSGSDARYRIPIMQDTDLPRIAYLSFADPAGDQQTNSVTLRRDGAATDSARELSINLTTLVLSVDDARQLGERYFRRRWNSRHTFELSLTAQRLAIEPGDVYTLALDSNITRTARNTKLTITGKENVLRCEWERDATILAGITSTIGATFDGRRDQVILVPQISKGFVLDIPLIRDADNDTNPILYYGAGPYTPGFWPGATFFQSADGTDYEEEIASVPSTAGLTWGFANGTLANATAAVWDRGNTVSVTVKNGELASATEAEIDANPVLNLAVLGSELLNFTTATLASEDANGKVYTLSGFKRGRRGTEWATSGHASGDQFILLDAVGNVEMGAGDIGDTLYFKAVTQGREVESAFPILVDPYEAESHKPYAPAWFEGQRTASGGDWVFEWNRRSRIGARWTGNSVVPLGETAENYELDIMDGVDVARTITATSETATYTTAQQTTDFGSAQASITARVRQVGDLTDGRNTTATF